MWRGDYLYVLQNLVLKDFRIRYRNMSLGVFWSLVNPLVMMGIFTFVFTRIFANADPYFPVFVMCGLVPYNFFNFGWTHGTVSVVESAGLIKRVQVAREVVPVATVLSSCLHLLIQMGLLILLTLAFGKGVNREWIWLPVLLLLEVIFVSGLALLFSAVNVFIRDTRYVVESAVLVMFYLTPVLYSHTAIPQEYRSLYDLNPVANLIFNLRRIFLEGAGPPMISLVKLSCGSLAVFALGYGVFARLEKGFYEYL
jgi:ABC-type polysaccharide/polyol phosphate export permease